MSSFSLHEACSRVYDSKECWTAVGDTDPTAPEIGKFTSGDRVVICEQADDEASLTVEPEGFGEVGMRYGDPSASKGDLRRGITITEPTGRASTPVQGHPVNATHASAEEAALRPRAWVGNAPSTVGHGVLSPRLKTLLKLQARGPITSVSTIFFPCPASRIKSFHPAFGPGANLHSHFTDDNTDSDDRMPSGEHREAAFRSRGDSGDGHEDGSAGGDAFQRGLASESGVEQAVSAAGVYVALGLRNETVQVMRLSHGLEGTRDIELVEPTQSDVADGMSFGFCGGLGGCADPGGGTGGGSSCGEGDSPESPEERLHGETLARERENWFDVDGTDGLGGERDDLSRPFRLDSVTSAGAGETNLVSSRMERPHGYREGNMRGGGDLEVHSEVHGDLPLSHNGWAGKGLVVPLAPAPSTPSVLGSVSPPLITIPVSHGRGGRSSLPTCGSWSSMKEGMVGGGGDSGAVGGEVGSREDGGVSGAGCGGDLGEAQAFGLCSSDGRVCCCQLICSPGMQPRWSTVWARQTEEVMFAFNRLDYPNNPERLGQSSPLEERKETLLVACAISGTTFLFDAKGGTCVTFDPGEYLRQPVTAFAAGDVTTGSGTTEPALVYLSAGGDVTVFHGLYEQAGPVSPPQFLQTIRSNGTLNTLERLLVVLRSRLERHPNQGDRLFPSPPNQAGADRGGVEGNHVVEDGATAHAKKSDVVGASQSGAYLKDALSASQSTSRRGRPSGALFLPDELLARAVLCRAGALKALPEAKREGAGGGYRKGAGSAPGERWRREARAIARGETSGVTVAEGLSAVKRVLKEIESFRARSRDRTLKRYPRLRGTLEALSLVA